MTEVTAWLLFPLVILALGLGCGLLVERAAGRRLAGVLLVPVGLAFVAVLADLLTRAAVTADWAAVAMVVCALAGLVMSRSRLLGLRPDPWAAAAAAVPFIALMAAVISGGAATFTGYTILDDASVHFSLLEHVFEDGHARASGGGQFAATVNAYLSTDYPLGSYLPLGVGWQLVGSEVAWLFQSWMGLLLSMVALSTYGALEGVGLRNWQRGLIAAAAAQSGLLYAYAQQGSVKEVATLWVLTLVVALGAAFLREGPSARATVPLAIATAAGISVLSLAVVPWLGVPLALVAGVTLFRARGARRRRALGALACGALITAVAAAPALVGAANFARVATGVLQSTASLGNLARPLDPLQLAGIWPRGDYRLPLVADQTLVYVLIALAFAGAAWGAIWLVRRRVVDGPLLLAGAGLVAVPYLLRRGAPYADGKTLAIGSAIVTVLALLGAAVLINAPRRPLQVAGAALAVAVAGGILWTNALAYHDSTVAAKDRFDELLALDDRFAGQPKTLFAEYEAYSGYLLRRSRAVSSHTFADPRTTAREAQAKKAYDLDSMDVNYVTGFPLIVQRRSPLASRPPSGFELVWSGRYYEAWRRVRPRNVVVGHLPVGNAVSSRTCRRIEEMGRRASRGGYELRYALRPSVATFRPARAPTRPPWRRDGNSLRPVGAGLVEGTVPLDGSGSYRVWLGGTFSRGVEARVDRSRLGEVSYELGWAGQFFDLGAAELAGGARPVELERGGGDLRGGNGFKGTELANLVLAPEPLDRRVREIDPRRARSLCTRPLDWVELVRR